MTKRTILGTAAMATVLAATLSTAALAERGGPGRMGGDMGPGAFALNQFDDIDGDKDGKITQAELEAYRTGRVTALDGNGDGKISLDELKAQHMARIEERATEMATRMMERMDSDGDGQLTAAELAVPAPPAQMIGRVFDRLDTDGDDAVSRAEVEAAQQRMAEGHGGAQGEGRGHGRGEGRPWWGMGRN